MIAENSYMIIKVDYNVKEGNNAHITFIDNEDEFIENIKKIDGKYDDYIIFKNGIQMRPYDCMIELEAYEFKSKLFGL
ncbi:hypothetical protein [Romboutsia ilealis]|uniref:hypothetical protein n=1 Tax=Romboutsia ilealis TaxID=1115758 RepID=UPI002729B8C4|nr:hypothetical protein [Romboutsia ilealis]